MNENSLSSSGLNNSQPGQNNGKKDDIDDEQEEIKHFLNVFNAFQYYRSLKNTFFCLFSILIQSDFLLIILTNVSLSLTLTVSDSASALALSSLKLEIRNYSNFTITFPM